MSAEVVPKQSLGSHRHYEAQPNFGMLTDKSQLYATTDAWGTIPPTNNFPSAANYLKYPMPPDASQADPQFTFSTYGASSQSNASTQAPSQKELNAASVIAYNHSLSGPSSVQVSPGPVGFGSDSRNDSIVEPPHLDGTQNAVHYTDSIAAQTRTASSRKPSRVGRKRKMEQAEPGSDRAIYLEKNRQAASKCRNKQKRQQDHLVDQAREFQVRNKCLKAEVDLLQHELRVYMEYAGHHHQCLDTRLAIYLQREADRLSSGTTRASASPHSPTFSMQTPFTLSIEYTPKDRAGSIN